MMAVILQEPADKGAHVEAVVDEHEVADDEAGKGENDGDDEDGVDADDDDEARFSAQDLQQRFSPFFSCSCFLEKQLLFRVSPHSVHTTFGILLLVQT